MFLQSRSLFTKTLVQLTITTPRPSLLLKHLWYRPMASHDIPKTMKGVLIEKTGGTEVLQYRTDLPVPTPGDNEVLVKNDYIGINYIDTYFRTGLYSSPKPEILGREASGHIVSLGSSVSDFSIGDRVVWMGTGEHGNSYSLR